MTLQLSLFSPKFKVDEHRTAKTDLIDPFLAAHEQRLLLTGDDLLTFDNKLWNHKSKSAVGVDVETYENFFLVCFKRFGDGTRLAFELSERSELNCKGILYVLQNNLTVSFNGLAYDNALIFHALGGADNARLKQVSDQIINGGVKPWELGIRVPSLNHIDLAEPNPSVRQGLKMLHGRLGGRYMVDLPFHPDTLLTPRQMNITTLYCHNDLDATELLYDALKEPMRLRFSLGHEHGMDLRSKSDSQIGENIIKKSVEKALGMKIGKGIVETRMFSYDAPTFLSFEDSVLSQLLMDLKTTVFSINAAGKIDTPPILENLTVRLGAAEYAMGIGGLHSMEAHRALHSDDERQLIDVDVASQYPSIIMKLGLYPAAMGPAFLDIYGRLIKERLAAKASGDKIKADGGRIALNGVYGKLGSPYSPLYAPHLVVAITLTGQLSILMLIERAERAGIPVVSANTDGVVFFCPMDKADTLSDIITAWEHITGFKVECTPYRALYNASVNTYIAVKEDGKVKRKGYIADPWEEGDLRGQMSKNPQMQICSRAIVRYITDGTPIEDTIRGCTDPRAFVTVIKVTGGGVWRGQSLGRAVRYYWSLDSDPIYADNGRRKVAKTDGAKPLFELTDQMPPDIDFLRYCLETVKIANDLGITL